MVLEDLVDLASDGGVGAMATSFVLLQVLHNDFLWRQHHLKNE